MFELQEFQNIPLAELRESKTNPRRQENAAALKELTESVRDRGVLVPLLARPVDGKFEIVAGSRRYQAAKEVGLKSVPAYVHTMTDSAALEIQIIENLQREDVHPLDEGLGYRTLMEKSKLNVPAIAKKVGKSASYVYQRMKLADLDKSVQKATLEKRISAGHAILIARLQPREQSEALKYCGGRNYIGEGASVRELSGWIQRKLHLDLNSAAFKKDDAGLLPAAGPCTTCPKRAGNNPELYRGLKADTCTDRTCYRAKMTAYIGRKEKELIDAGEKVISISSEYVPGPEKKGSPLSYDKWTEVKKGSCSSVRKGILAWGPRHGQVLNVCADMNCKVHRGYSSGSSKRTVPSAEEIRRREQEEAKKTVRRQLFKAVVDKVPAKFGRKDLELVAASLLREIWHENRKRVVEMLGWAENKKSRPHGGLDYEQIGAARIHKLTHLQLGQFIIALSLAGDLDVPERYASQYGNERDALRAVAKRYRVDEAKITRTVRLELDARRKAKAQREKKRQAAEKAAKPKPSAKRKKPAPAKKAKVATPRKKWRRQRGSWVASTSTSSARRRAKGALARKKKAAKAKKR